MSKTDFPSLIKTQAAVFLDRDGTIIKEVNYLSRLEEVELLPRAAAAIAKLNHQQIPVILVSNQSGIARGKFNHEFVNATHNLLQTMLAHQGARLDDFFFCPHHPESGRPPFKKICGCRKPEPGLLYEAAARHHLELAQSYVVGDKLLDVELARRVGGKGLLVETGHGEREKKKISESEIKPDYIAADLDDAVIWILANLQKGK